MESNTRNSAYTKSYNRKLILDIIRKEPLSRAALSRKTGLTRAAITIIADELISDGIIAEKGTAESSYGRKPVLLDINPECYFAMGLNISRVKCSIGIINIKGNLVARQEIDLSNMETSEKAIEAIIKELKKLPEDKKIPREKLLGLGISTPGPVDIYAGRILNPPNFDFWKNVDIVERLKKDLPFEIFLENVSVALTLAEKYFGKGKGFNSFVNLAVDDGIGSGMIINNKLYRGIGGFGGEIGHTSINFGGETCNCGNTGCLELYASIPAVLKNVRQKYPDVAAWADIADRALAGEQFFLDVIDKEAMYLSVGIINAINTLQVEAVILTGDIKYKPQMILESINERVNRSIITRNMHPVKIYSSEITNDSDIIAPSTIVIDNFYRH